MDIRGYINKLPVSDRKKLEAYNSIMKPIWYFKSLAKKSDNYELARGCFVHQNSYYGHEYWLKKYSGYSSGPLYSLIEHGICFEDYTKKDGWEPEWGIGSIMPFGEARTNMLRKLYPDFKIVPIGPRIHYADIDMCYYEELKSLIDPSSKTIVLYPSHSLESAEYKYDTEMFYKNAMDFAADNDIKNVLVSLHPSDIIHGYIEEYRKISKNLVLVTGGSNNKLFLPRLKAILSIADITYSNKFGTHVGYSVYMGKPHIINPSSDNNSYMGDNAEVVNELENLKKNEEGFNKVFNGTNPWQISKEQRDLVDYHFGLSYVKSKEDMFNIINECKIHYQKYYK